MVVRTKEGREHLKPENQTLSYCLSSQHKPTSPITLDLFEAEKYQPAVIVQQLIGNLVYYSNHGRYEPRLAESWQRLTPKIWSFKLKSELKCENGEAITTESFKKSLERSIITLSKKGNLPVFNKLLGYSDFLKGKSSLDGIVALNEYLEFHFEEPIRSGLVQFLSFAPFGYICQGNLASDGSWKDKTKFISSGAYRVKDLSIGIKYVLEKRPDWIGYKENSPDIVSISHNLPAGEDLKFPGIIDSFSELASLPNGYSQFQIVPEYLNTIALGGLKSGFFSSLKNRKIFKTTINHHRSVVPQKWNNHIQSSTFYPSQQLNKDKVEDNISIAKGSKPETFNKHITPLMIEGKNPLVDTPRWYAWQILHAALEDLGWPYKFANNESTWSEMSDTNYDIRIRNPSVGGGVEPWGLGILFCSPLGSKLPDPSGKICQMLEKYENNQLDDEELSKLFFKSIEDDSAVIPISHYGIQWYISSGIKQESISPLISVVRFDDLELE
jgi:hypothetical protein